MLKLLAWVAAHKVVAAVAVVSVVTFGVVAGASSDGNRAVVVRVVDGDTVDVRFDGRLERVRLLNVDTPETVDPDRPVECLGEEATAFLAETLPSGTEVTLEFDVDRQDRYGRLLAGVFVGQELVNAEIARRGLGVAMLVEPNDRFYDDVAATQAEAVAAGVGLFGTDVACSLPAQVEDFAQKAETASGAGYGLSEDLSAYDVALSELAGAVAAGVALDEILSGGDAWPGTAYPAAMRAGWAAAIDADVARLEATIEDVERGRRELEERLEAERAAAEEAARVAAEEAARAAAEEAARAAQQAAIDAAQEEARRTSDSCQVPADSSGSSGYTGCRAYAPGGKTWTPIPCP